MDRAMSRPCPAGAPGHDTAGPFRDCRIDAAGRIDIHAV
jgi:hypothetical protein